MKLSIFVLCALFPLIAQVPAEPPLVSRLKTTPVSSIEASLPDKPFDAWLTDLFQPPKYEVNHCQVPGKESEWCVNVTAVKGIQMVHLTFLISQEKHQEGTAKPAKIEFLGGDVGPSNPQMKMPTRLLSKLSDLEKRFHPTAP
jgi:hypothetical protein